jgi:hypothetical protein
MIFYLSSLALAQSPRIDPAKVRLILEGLSDVYGQVGKEYATKPDKLRFNATNPGDVASGVEIKRTNDWIAIDITPCATYKTIVTFTNPYTTTQIDDIKCQTHIYPQLQVIQQ